MIERAAQQQNAVADGRFEDDPRTARLVHGRMDDAQRLGVVPDAREALAAKSLVSGVPVGELARRADAVDAAVVDWRAYCDDAEAEFKRDRSRHEAAMQQIDALLSQRGMAS